MILQGVTTACISFWTVLIFLYRGNAQLTVQPVSVVQAEGLEAVFECLYPGAFVHGWRINGELLTDDQFPPAVTRISPSVGSPTARLFIPATPQYNNTVVQCEAVVRVGGVGIFVLSENATLEVQGPLQSVSNLHFDMSMSSSTDITISWDPPFSLNLTTAEPDIQYCVDVYNVTGEGDDHLQSVCDITDTYYTFTASDPNQLFNLTVTPRSNVEGSLNGTTSEPVQGSLISEPVVIDNKIEAVISAKSGKAEVQMIIPRDLLGSPGRIPTHYTIEVDCYQTSLNCSDNPNMNDLRVLTVSCDIEKHQNCSLTLHAENNAGTTKYTPSLEISTYHVQKIRGDYSIQMNQIDISCSFLNGSTDPGFLVIIYSPLNSLPTYCAAVRNKSNPTTDVSISGKFENPMIAVYDLQKDTGLPEKRPAGRVSGVPSNNMDTDNMLLNSGERVPSSIESFIVKFSNGEICMNCSFSAPELTGCVGVIHSAQLDNLTLTVLTVESSGEVKCSEIEEGDYTVAVFGWLGAMLEQEPALVGNISSGKSVVFDRTPSEDISTSPAAVLSTVVVTVVVVVVVVTITNMMTLVLVVKMKRKRRVFNAHTGGEELPPRYEDLPLNITRTEYENVALTTLTRTDTALEQQDESIVSNSQTHMENHLEMLQPQQESSVSPLVVLVSGISGTVDQGIVVHYAHVDIKSDSDQPSKDPTTVQYASIDKQKLVPVSGDSQDSVKEAPAPPSPPPPPSPETVLFELHPIAVKWEQLGEALGVSEHILDNISIEGSDQVRLHEVVQYYFSTKQFPHSWEEIVRALWEIGETEAADRIVRTKNLESEISLAATPLADPPPLPPRDDECSVKLTSVKLTSTKFPQSVVESGGTGESSQDETETRGKLTNDSGPGTFEQDIFKSHVNKNEVQYHEQHVPQVEDTLEIQQEIEESYSTTHEWSSRSYYSSLAHSHGLYQSLDVPQRHKARAIRTLTCCLSDLIHSEDLVQQKMKGLESQDSMTNNDCHKPEKPSIDVDNEESGTDIDHINNSYDENLSTMADLMNRNNNFVFVSEYSVLSRSSTKYSVLGGSGTKYPVLGETGTKYSVLGKLLDQKMIVKNTPGAGGSDVSSSNQPSGDHEFPSQEADSDASLLTELVVVTPLGLAATEPLTMSTQYGDEGCDSPQLTLVEPVQENMVSDQQMVHEGTEEKDGKDNYPRCRFFSWLIGTFHPPEYHHSFKGMLLREHGCIFQPEDGEEFLSSSGDGQGYGERILLPDPSRVKREELMSCEHLLHHIIPSELGLPSFDQLKTLNHNGDHCSGLISNEGDLGEQPGLEEIDGKDLPRSTWMQMKISSLSGCMGCQAELPEHNVLSSLYTQCGGSVQG